MPSLDYRNILLEQREEIALPANISHVQREKASEIDMSSNLAQIITGIRRCGKSTLALMMLNTMDYAYVNFDDERLINLGANQLNDLFEALYTVYGRFEYLFFDEIQNVEGWHLFVNRLLRKKIKIVLTGSNSKLLSREMATHLTGRYKNIELMPYSFTEFLQARKLEINHFDTAREKGLALKYFEDYLHSGGMPEVVHGEEKDSYIRSLFEAIVTRDVFYRYEIRHTRTFREMALWLTGNFSKEISYNRIKNIFGLGSENTAKNYLSYLEEAWLFVTLQKFSFKKQESLRYRKLYLADVSFASLSGESASPDRGRLLENIVLLQLMRHRLRRHYEIFYFKDTVEVDFVIYGHRKVIELIQVALSLDDQKTLRRETRALLAANNALNAEKLTIITLNQKEDIVAGELSIQAIPIAEWLLETSDAK
jgi:uncharacterized protein